jgi:hypothetical protein
VNGHFHSRPLYLRYPLDRKLDGPQSRFRRGGEKKKIPILPLPRIENRSSSPYPILYIDWAAPVHHWSHASLKLFQLSFLLKYIFLICYGVSEAWRSLGTSMCKPYPAYTAWQLSSKLWFSEEFNIICSSIHVNHNEKTDRDKYEDGNIFTRYLNSKQKQAESDTRL